MKIFLLDHMPFVLLYLFNMIFLFVFYRRLGGFETLANVYYFIFLRQLPSGNIFVIYRYLSGKGLYEKLSRRPY